LIRLIYRRRLTVDPVEAPAMKLPRVRFTVRRLMVVVATVAIGIGAGAVWRRRDALLSEYRSRMDGL
jgi:hypothetical protein